MLRLLIAVLLLIATLQPAAAEPAKGFDKTWSMFQNALRRKSPDALARISKFPIHSNEFGGSISTPEVLNKRFGNIFTPKTIRCLLAQKPQRMVHNKKVYFEAFCDNDRYPIRYIFEIVGSEFRFTSIDNINE
jgi:hypothetical protein